MQKLKATVPDRRVWLPGTCLGCRCCALEQGT